MNPTIADFVGETIVPREVERNGKKFTFHFAELSALEAEDLFTGVDGKDQKKNKGLRSRIIATVVRTDDGKAQFTTEEAGKLPLTLANKLKDIALDVNGLLADKDAETKKE